MVTAQAAASALAEYTGVDRHDIVVVMGSGWQQAIEQLGAPTATIPMEAIPGLLPPTAEGHRGTIASITVGPHSALVMMGRHHLYEGYSADEVVFPIRVAHAAGTRIAVLTNAAGGIRPGQTVGRPVLIGDQLNLTGHTPLSGATFVDMTRAYDPQLRKAALAADPTLTEGVYAGLAGPQYETPAEVRMLASLGADLVGMSTVLETIAARALDMRVLGISLVTNLAAGTTGLRLDHAEVLAEGRSAAGRLGVLLRKVLAGELFREAACHR